jgi:hypothetical protein
MSGGSGGGTPVSSSGTYTYTFSPSTNFIDQLRLMLGDTGDGNPSVSTCIFADEELNYFETEGHGNAHLSAHHACVAAAAKYSKLADKTLGPMSIQYSQIAAAFKTQAKEEFDNATNSANVSPQPYSFTTEDGDRDRSLEDGTTKKVPAEFYRDMEEDYGDIASEDDLRIHWT